MSVRSLMRCMNSQNNITLESKDSITALISLGANLPSRFGTPVQTLSAAITRIAGFGNGKLFASSFYQTEAVDCQPETPDFINAVVAVPLPKSITASELLDFLQELEKEFGRSHDVVKNSPRNLDLDVLYFGNQLFTSHRMEIPRPRAAQRRFVIEPLTEIAPNVMLPGQSVSVQALLENLPICPKVTKLR